MSSNYDLTEQEIKEGIRLCNQNVNLLLDDAEAILARGDRYISSGLYTYAVEELGKLLLLQKELNKTPINNKISVDPDIFVSHIKKFNEFLNESSIPNVCKELKTVVGGVPIVQYQKIGDVMIPIPTGVIPIYNLALTKFSLRQNIFYVDWKNNTWVRRQDIEVSDLIEAITELRKWLSGKNYNSLI